MRAARVTASSGKYCGKVKATALHATSSSNQLSDPDHLAA
jgi:hypothetical protein